MTTETLQRAIDAAGVLAPHEKYQLIEAVARSLRQADTRETQSAAFLHGRTIDELIAEQQPPVITDLLPWPPIFGPPTSVPTLSIPISPSSAAIP